MTITPLTLPTQDELPCDDGIPMETQRHKMQSDIATFDTDFGVRY